MAHKKSKGGYPEHVQMSIMRRFMDEKQIASFMDSYEEFKNHRSFSINDATAEDRRIHGHFLKNLSIGKTAKELLVSSNRVYSAIARVSAAASLK